MTARSIPAAELGAPRLTFDGAPEAADAFDLSSHARAREALAYGLTMREPGFHVFVVGEDRSGRMTATLEYLEAEMKARAPASDWVYLNNFRHTHRPRPYALPAGTGRRFRDRVAALVPRLRDALARAFSAESYQALVRTRTEALRGEASQRFQALRAKAQQQGFDIVDTERGAMIAPAEGKAPPPAAMEIAQRIGAELEEINRWMAARQGELAQWHHDLSRQITEQTAGALIDEVAAEFQGYRGLARWLTEMRVDIAEHVPQLVGQPPEALAAALEAAQRRYSVNLLVDRGDDAHAAPVVEPNPTYENLFGRIDYRQEQGALSTDFSMIRAGSLHRANGGILVLRAEALAADPEAWTFLKAALRDREIRIEERHRAGAVPLAGAPRPKPIALDVKVVMVGHPRWYYTFFALDPDFQTHFKIRAEIDPDLPSTPPNVATYVGIIREKARLQPGMTLARSGVERLLGMAARWADDRERLTARFEMIDDLIAEAAAQARVRNRKEIDAGAVDTAVHVRRQRNARIEDKVQESIAIGQTLLDVTGSAIGQINALTVREAGDHSFGAPSRITARAAMGRRGVVNIERDVELGGPIQQKGAMVIQGWLMGHFARRTPLSFTCSVTFEQSYGGVEGDSASLAELLAILSDVAQIPLRQDLAITGSVNQRGQAQPIGGVRHKIEGFFRACLSKGGLTGTQGVVVPKANERNLVLRDDVAAAVEAGKFKVWSVETIDDAVELFTGLQAGAPDRNGAYPASSVYGRVMADLEAFDRRLGPGSQG